MKEGAWRLGLAGFLLAVAMLAAVGTNPPPVVPAGAPTDQFSAERAFAHVQAIAREPHSSGSKASADVREYIRAQLAGLGLTVQTQVFAFKYRWGGTVEGVNLLARLPGRGGSRTNAILLACHHDSVAGSPGASDDGAGIATLLETARALKSGHALSRDVLFLFTDGEESGLNGARAFVDSPAAKEIELVLNFDARGVSGPVFMFETSAQNGFLIREFGRAAPFPTANSLMYEVYRRMPNNTDLTIFKRAGFKGLNFAFMGDPRHYHKPTDDAAHFTPRTLQHEGSYALSLTRHFGSLDLAIPSMQDAVYFDVLGRWFVNYSGAAAEWLAGLVTALFLLRLWKTRPAQPGKWLVAALIWMVFIAVAGGIFFFVHAPWLLGVAITVLLGSMTFVLARRRMAAEVLAAGGLLWWLALTLLLTLAVRGASYVALWPLGFGLLGLWLPRRLAAFTAVPLLLIVFPLVRQFYIALGPQALFIPMVVLALILAALPLQLEEIIHGNGKTTAP